MFYRIQLSLSLLLNLILSIDSKPYYCRSQDIMKRFKINRVLSLEDTVYLILPGRNFISFKLPVCIKNEENQTSCVTSQPLIGQGKAGGKFQSEFYEIPRFKIKGKVFFNLNYTVCNTHIISKERY